LQQSGFELAVISGRNVPGVKHRLTKLGIQHIFLGVEDKKAIFHSLIEELKLTPIQTAYMGDDLPDLSLLKTVGLGVTVPNAVQEVLEEVSFVTHKKGGKGAVREFCEAVLKSQLKWEPLLLKFR
jgi:3-deoxy-D-manno-octulosonate 8-phosphate phosphatase (KDO 8-P phosphatase)